MNILVLGKHALLLKRPPIFVHKQQKKWWKKNKKKRVESKCDDKIKSRACVYMEYFSVV